MALLHVFGLYLCWDANNKLDIIEHHYRHPLKQRFRILGASFVLLGDCFTICLDAGGSKGVS